MMSDGPDLRFEVDREEEAARGRAPLLNRFRRLRMYWATIPLRALAKGWGRRGGEMPIVYRIVPVEKTGRFERADEEG
jgi:hypothetical protein